MPFWSHQTQSLTFFRWISGFALDKSVWQGLSHCFCWPCYRSWSTFCLQLRFSKENSFVSVWRKKTQVLNHCAILIVWNPFSDLQGFCSLNRLQTVVWDNFKANSLVDLIGFSTSIFSKMESSASTGLSGRSMSLRSRFPPLNRANQLTRANVKGILTKCRTYRFVCLRGVFKIKLV